MTSKSFLLCVALISALGSTAAGEGLALKDAYKGAFRVGVAVNAKQAADQDSRGDPIIKREFNSLSAEDDMKWERIHPTPDAYNFTVADQYVAFGVKNDMYTVGHVLVWHSQTPDWVFRDKKGKLLTRDALLKRMREHIFTVVGRYRGKIKAWDVVNEAIADDGGMRQSLWYKIIGPDYVEKAFEYAHEADPDAELIYSDYSLENAPKRKAALELLKRLKAEGTPVTTVGLQGHYIMDWPSMAQLDEAISDIAALGLKVAVTELDIDVLPRGATGQTADVNVRMDRNTALNPYTNGLPADVEKMQTERYAGIFSVCLKHRDTVNRITIWGVTDADTWHNDWPMKGRTAYSLLFDRAGNPKAAYRAVVAAAQPPATLKEAYKGAFVVGAAINADQALGRDTKALAVLTKQFNAISPENDLKWERIHPTPDRYDFRVPDAYVDFGTKHHMYTVGHVLVWHNQTPAWVFRDQDGNPLSRKLLLERLRAHILTVVGRYRGRINAWDVVNEALNEDGSLRQSPWYKILGEDYIAQAFRFAHEADPNAELLYNDFSIENPAKRAGVVALIKKLKAEGVPVTTVGIQGHYDLTWPTVQQLDDTIAEFAKLGVKVAITELDVGVLPAAGNQHTAEITLRFGPDPALNPYPKALPDTVQQQLAKRYGELFAVFYKHRDVVDRVTTWGISDKDTWKNDWPVKGRTDYPMLFDRADQPKPAFFAALAAAGK